MAELNGQRIDALATQAQIEKTALAELNGQRIDAIIAQGQLEKVAQAELNGQRIDALAAQADLEKTAMAELNGQRIDAIAANELVAEKLAEKQAIEEIKWAAMSVKGRIAELEKLKVYQATFCNLAQDY